MKIGDKIKFYLFGQLVSGVVYEVDKAENTVSVMHEGYKYSKMQTLGFVPRKKKDIPPWYILK